MTSWFAAPPPVLLLSAESFVDCSLAPLTPNGTLMLAE